MGKQLQIRDLVLYKPATAEFALSSEIDEKQFNDAIAARVGRASNDERVQRRALVMALREPIDYAVQFISWTEPFFMRETYGPLEDNKYPLEDGLQPVALQTSHLGQVTFNEANFLWTRPDFEQWSIGVKFPWKVLERSGWNISTRMMQRASDALARIIDTAARVVIDAAIVAAGNVSVDAGGILQQATLDAIIKAHETAAQPLVAVHINRGDIVDLATWAGGPLAAGNMPTSVAEELLRNLHFGNYGAMQWIGSSWVPAGYCYLRGLNTQIGVHQVKGSMRTDSDTDITRGIDFTTIRTADHAWSIVAAYFLHRITC